MRQEIGKKFKDLLFTKSWETIKDNKLISIISISSLKDNFKNKLTSTIEEEVQLIGSKCSELKCKNQDLDFVATKITQMF